MLRKRVFSFKMAFSLFILDFRMIGSYFLFSFDTVVKIEMWLSQQQLNPTQL